MVHVTSSYISRLERGLLQNPTMKTLEFIAECIGCSSFEEFLFSPPGGGPAPRGTPDSMEDPVYRKYLQINNAINTLPTEKRASLRTILSAALTGFLPCLRPLLMRELEANHNAGMIEQYLSDLEGELLKWKAEGIQVKNVEEIAGNIRMALEKL